MTDKQSDDLVKKKLVDYLNRMGHLPDKAGRYHCIAADHKDGNPSMTIHKSGAYATCWSHPSPKDSFTIFDAIGVFEGIQSPKAQKKRAYEIYQAEIDDYAAELAARAGAKKTDEAKPSAHIAKPKDTTHAGPAAPKHEEKEAVKVPEHKYSRPVKPDIFAPKTKETPLPPSEPIAQKDEEKVIAKAAEHKEPLSVEAAAPKAADAPQPKPAEPKAADAPLPKPAEPKAADTPQPKTAELKAADTPLYEAAEPKAEQTAAAKSPEAGAPKADPGRAATAAESKDDKIQAGKTATPTTVPKAGSQRTMDNRPPSVDFQEWKKRVSQIYNLKLDNKPETPPRTPQTGKEAEIKQSTSPVEPPKATVAPKRAPIEPDRTPIVPVPVYKPKQVKPATDDPGKTAVKPAKAAVEPVKAPPVPVQKPEPDPKAKPVVEPVPAVVPAVETVIEPVPAEVPAVEPVPAVADAAEPAVEPVPAVADAAELAVEPVSAEEPAAEPAVEPVSAEEPAAESAVEPVSAEEPAAESAVEPVPVIELEADLVVEPVPAEVPEVEPAAEPAVEPVPVIELEAEPVPEPAIDTYLSQISMTSLLADLQSPEHAHDWPATQSTGLPGLDDLLDGGLHPGLYMICSRPGEGKTSFALQIADTIAAQGKDVLWISLDMTRAELLSKSLSRMTLLLDSAINKKNACTAQAVLEGLRNGPTKAVLQKALQTYHQTMSSFMCQEALSEQNITDVEHIISRHMTVTGSKPVVFIDCLQYLQHSDGLTETAGIDRAARSLMQFGRINQIPVLALSADIRDSYNSDVIISLQMEPATGTLVDPHVVELELLKNRHGAFNRKISLNFFAAFSCLEEK